MEKAVESLSRDMELNKLMPGEMTWNLEDDLLSIAEGYLAYIEKLKDLILISFQEAEMFPELKEKIALIPKQLKDNLVSYFIEMREKESLLKLIWKLRR